MSRKNKNCAGTLTLTLTLSSALVLILMVMLMVVMAGCAADEPVNSGAESRGTEIPAAESSQDEPELQETAEADTQQETAEAGTLQAPVIGEWVRDDSEIDEFGGAAGINVSWSRVGNAQKYEYRFIFVWNGGSSTVDSGETEETSASCYFQDIGEVVRVEVRAVGEVNGETIYSEWSSAEIDEDEIYRITGLSVGVG